MAISAYVRDDRFMLIGLGIATASLLFAMQKVLVRYRDASEIKPIQPKTQYITQETEDSLPMTTLDSLLGHYNYSIRETASKIVCDRAVNDTETLKILLWGITLSDYDERMKNLRALAMLTDQNSLAYFNHPLAYGAFVQSLEHCVAESNYEPLNDMFYDECYLRDMAEKLCLMFLDQLTAKFGVAQLVRAQFVERWLAQQRWGTTQQERMDNFVQYLNCRDNRIADLCRRLRGSSIGRTALERARLIQPWRLNPSPVRVMTDDDNQRMSSIVRDSDRRRRRHGNGWHRGTGGANAARPTSSSSTSSSSSSSQQRPATNGTITAQAAVGIRDSVHESGNGSATEQLADPLVDPTLAQTQQIENLISFGERILRRRDSTTIDIFSNPEMLFDDYDRAGSDRGGTLQARPAATSSTEEQRIRRQHREAMVLNDGTRPLRRDDIIERESD